MLQIPSDFLALSTEPALLARAGRISFANSAALDLLGSDCVGKTVRSFFGEELVGTQSPSFVCDVVLSSVHYVARVTKSEGVQAIFLSHRDETPALLNDAFLYSMRSYLMSFGVAADIARKHAEDIGDVEMLRQLASMTQGYYRARRAVSNISICRSASAGTLFLNAMDFDLRELTAQLIGTVGILFGDSGIVLAPGKSVVIHADPALIEQLLLNLISNCLMHAQGRTRISINILETRDSVVISVDDDGCGIPADKLHTAFDRYRHGYDMSDIGGGAGLGLTVVRMIANMHGGTLLLESREGIGTTIRVSIARRSADSAMLGSHNTEWTPAISSVLIGLAECLPLDSFTEKYSD